MIKNEINYINSADVVLEDTTTVMRQYLNIKREHEGSILLYRLGDFYETFFEDAVTLSRDLEITLTGRDAGKVYGRVPLAGIPIKAVNGYLQKLLEKGHKIAICEQLEDPKDVKKGEIVKRGVVRTITAGTIIESDFLEQNSNNYIAGVFEEKGKWGIAYADISTGEIKATQGDLGLVLTELARIKPAEIIGPSANQEVQPFQIVPEEVLNLPEEITTYYNCSKIPAKVFEERFAYNNLRNVYPSFSEATEGYKEFKMAFRAASAVLAYVWENMKSGLPKFEFIKTYELSDFVLLDNATRRNLELVETMRDRSKVGTLLWAVDKTVTNMGARLLKTWICQPLKNVEKIRERQEVVTTLVDNYNAREALNTLLKEIYDIQRISTKLSNESGNPRDFLNLKYSLAALPEIFSVASKAGLTILDDVARYESHLSDFYDIIERTIDDKAPITIKEGGIIKDGVNGELDYFRDLMFRGEKWKDNYEAKEREATGIQTLKVNYNKVFGFYIEVTNANSEKVPDTYTRKQTLANAERYITPELKKHEDDVLSAQFKSVELERKLFTDFRAYSKEYVEMIRELAAAIAQLDCLLSFAKVAVESNYVKPEIDDSLDINIKNGRHPVIEKLLPLGAYVCNDLELSVGTPDITQFMILTGPNMAGKSTYMRQNALITVLAQIGSYVPADYAKIGAVDKIFTRVGASDDLALGRSTFMVEMSEVSEILKNATTKSLVILDEIGRGTSTFDGMSIAKAVVEYIYDKKNNLGCKTLFATHYHELTDMENKFSGVVNYNIAVKKRGDEITFLRKIVKGGADDSFGIQVAKLAGVPDAVIERAKVILAELEENARREKMAVRQLSFDDALPMIVEHNEREVPNEIVKELEKVDVNVLTPIEALNILNKLKSLL